MSPENFEVLHANLYILVRFWRHLHFEGEGRKMLSPQYFYWGDRRLC